jgi:hypothetical protein
VPPFLFIASFPHPDNANDHATPRPDNCDHFVVEFANADPSLLAPAMRLRNHPRPGDLGLIGRANRSALHFAAAIRTADFSPEI